MADKDPDKDAPAAKTPAKAKKAVPNIQQLSGQFAVASDGQWYTLSAGQMTEETEHGVVTKPCVTLTPVPVQVAEAPGEQAPESEWEQRERQRAEWEKLDREKQARAVEESKREREEQERREKERQERLKHPERSAEPATLGQPATGARRV